MKKYKITSEVETTPHGIVVYRIKALFGFTTNGKYIRRGELGGYVEREENLSQEGECWVDGSAMVYGDAHIFGRAYVGGSALVWGSGVVCDSACVYDYAHVWGGAKVCDTAHVFDYAQLNGYAGVFGDSCVGGNAQLTSRSDVLTITQIGKYGDNATIYPTIGSELALVFRHRVFSIAEFEEFIKRGGLGLFLYDAEKSEALKAIKAAEKQLKAKGRLI